jgi:Tol biopolymer transport system component
VAARPDGSALREVSNGAAGQMDFFPSLSPDGRRVVFERDASDGVAIVIVDADGSHERTVDLGCVDPCDSDQIRAGRPTAAISRSPAWSARFDQVNGSARSAVLQVANLDGSHVHRLSQRGIDGAYEDYYARFLPDGRTVTFVRVRNAEVGPPSSRWTSGRTARAS